MNIIWTTLVLLAALALSAADLLATEKNLNFVDVLKQDLRKNNDDYIESMTNTTTTSDSTTETSRSPSTIANEEIIGKSNDEYNSLAETQRYNKATVKDRNNSTVQPSNQRRFFNEVGDQKERKFEHNLSLRPVVRHNKVVLVSNAAREMNDTAASIVRTVQTVANKTPMRSSLRSNEGELLKNFMSRYKDRFNEFLNKKRLESKITMETRTEPMTTTLKRKWYSSSAEQLVRQRAFDEDHPPDPSRLDMAPANGGKIHALRVKGRLCQRNVMLPEGPKYDSRGRMYLGPYTHLWGRDYSHTRRPRLLLPRCCNCCKKSVLGCE